MDSLEEIKEEINKQKEINKKLKEEIRQKKEQIRQKKKLKKIMEARWRYSVWEGQY